MSRHDVRVRFSVEPDGPAEDNSEFLANVIAVAMQRSLFLAGFVPTHGVTVAVSPEAITVHSALVPDTIGDLPI